MIKNKNKIFLCSAAGCILAGAVLFGAGISMGGNPQFSLTGSGLHLKNLEEEGQKYELSKTSIDPVSEISLKVDMADVEFLTSEDQNYYVEYSLYGNTQKPEFQAEGGRLVIEEKPEKGVQGFQFGFLGDFQEEKYYVKIYLPEKVQPEKVEVDNENGNVSIKNLEADSCTVKADYGDIFLDQYTGKQLSVEADAGDIRAGEIEAEEAELLSDYGDVEIESFQGEKGNVELESGELRIKKADMKNLEIKSDYGDVTLGSSYDWEAYDLDLYTDYGEIQLKGYEVAKEWEQKLKIEKGRGKSLKITCDSGDITLEEKE